MSRRVTSPGSRAQRAGVVGRAHRHCRRYERAWMLDMDLYKNDPVATRAMALALMRQALALLDSVEESGPAAHLQMAVDLLLGAGRRAPEHPPRAN